MSEMVVFKAPKAFRQKLVAFCKTNGYNLSYACRKALEEYIVDPNLPPAPELWKDFIEWRKKLMEILEIMENASHKRHVELRDKTSDLELQLRVAFRLIEKLAKLPPNTIANSIKEEKAKGRT